MEIRKLRYFVEVVNTQNLSTAALNLFVTQPTLSINIKNMEKELDLKLFTHDNEPFQLTQAGKALYDHALILLKEHELMMDTMNRFTQQLNSEVIRIGLTALFAIQFTQQITKFVTANPNVEVQLIQDGSHQLQRKLVQKEIDVGLVSFPNYYSNQILLEPLQTKVNGYHTYVAMGFNHPLAHRTSLSFEDLKSCTFVSLSHKYVLGRLLEIRSKELNFKPHVLSYHDDVHSLVYNVGTHNSVALIPIEYKDIVPLTNLAWIPLDDRCSFFPIGIAQLKNQTPSLIIEQFIETIKAPL